MVREGRGNGRLERLGGLDRGFPPHLGLCRDVRSTQSGFLLTWAPQELPQLLLQEPGSLRTLALSDPHCHGSYHVFSGLNAFYMVATPTPPGRGQGTLWLASAPCQPQPRRCCFVCSLLTAEGNSDEGQASHPLTTVQHLSPGATQPKCP